LYRLRSRRAVSGKLHELESEEDDYLARIGAVSADAKRPILYLEAAGYITYSSTNGLRIAITAKGADMARELDSLLGRLNIFYKKHKEGVLWFTATVLVSLITTLIVNSAR